MARHIAPDEDGYVYRAVVNYPKENGTTFTYHCGPYTNVGTAKSQVTRETSRRKRHGLDTTGHVQRARVEWEDVD